MTSGQPSEVGMGANVGGVAPFNCGFIPTAIVYDFDVWGNPDTDPTAVRGICETAAQETAHAYGLDHEYYCPDPMTYLFNCGDKEFRDYDASCGEYSARTCMCGGSTQNSYQRILAEFGARPSVPPMVAITSPMDGATVQKNFIISVNASDDIAVDHVELWIDGAMIGADAIPDYAFVAPDSLSAGQHSIVARAVDNAGLLADSTAVTVNLKGPCASNSDCNMSEVCQADGSCIPGPTATGGLGSTCTANSDCISMMCDSDGMSMKCTIGCDATDPTSCPDGFQCTSSVCWPGGPNGNNGGASGGCSVNGSHGGAMSLVWFGFGFVGIVIVLRRRRRR
jgi:hypothetical protein